MRTEIVRLLHAVAKASNEASSPSEAISSCVAEICKYTGWSVGQAYLVPENAPNELILVHVWYSSDPEKYRLFREATHAASVVWGADIAGRVLATAKPDWRKVLSTDGATSAPQFQSAEECGLKSGFGFPVLVGREVAAVLEFFSDTEVIESAEISEMIELVASQLARVIERHWAERDLIRAREAAIDASSEKSDFLTQMSHEIRTPINAVMVMAQLLMGTSLSSEQTEYTGIIRQSMQSLLAVVNDILDISKIEAGKFDIETIEFQLENVVRDTSSMLLHLVKGKELQFSSTVDPSIPKILRGDSGQLKQVLVNLIGNAIKFTDEGRISILVLQQDQHEDSVVLRFEIEDTGIGIPQEMHSKIFEMFTQADMSQSRKFGGTGLGLSISRRLVEMMGGEVGFQSKEGIGSVFWFTVRLETLHRNSPALSIAGVASEVINGEPRLEKSLDASRIKNLKKMSSEMGGNLFAELLSLFKTNSPGHLKKIGAAIRMKNAEQLGKEAHYLKSSSANLGAAEMSDVCRRLEIIAENGAESGSFNDAAELGQKLQVLFTEACQELEKEATSTV